jgi:osmoprotectant transport system substrate-binding protein
VPVVRKEAVDRFGARLTQAVDRVSSSLHTKDLTELNRRVSIDGVKPARAATDWLRSRGLVRT